MRCVPLPRRARSGAVRCSRRSSARAADAPPPPCLAGASVSADSAATSAGFSPATSFATVFANAMKSSFFATKSVSQLTSTMAALLPSSATEDADDAFGRHAAGGLAGLGAALDAQQFLGLGHVAARFGQRLLAFHHAQPVRSRSSFTMLAEISAISCSIHRMQPGRASRSGIVFRGRARGTPRPATKGPARLLDPFPARSGRRFVGDLDELVTVCGDFLDHLACPRAPRRPLRARTGGSRGSSRRCRGSRSRCRRRLLLVSTTATIGMPSFFASVTAILWKPTSITNSASGNAAHVLDAAQRSLELVELALVAQRLALGHALEGAVRAIALHVLQPLDRLLDGLEVREHAAEPAVVDVRACRRAAPPPRRSRAPGAWCRRRGSCPRLAAAGARTSALPGTSAATFRG